MTLFQGRFEDKNIAIIKNLISEIDFSGLKSQKLINISRWGEWIFLNFKKGQNLIKTHSKIVARLLPFRRGKAIDFLNKEYMTKAQIESFESTGYQFSGKEFMPHITIFSIPNYKEFDDLNLDVINAKLKKCMNQNLGFEKAVIYTTGPGGSCKNTIFERKL